MPSFLSSWMVLGTTLTRPCGGEVGCLGLCTSVPVACVSRSPDFPVGSRNGLLMIRPRVPLVGRGVRGVRGVEGDSEVHWTVIMFP